MGWKRIALGLGVLSALSTVARADLITFLNLATLVQQPHGILSQIVTDVAVAPTGETLLAGCEVTPANTTTLKLYFYDAAGTAVGSVITVSHPGVMRLMQVAAGPTAFLVLWDATGAPGDSVGGGIYFITYSLTGTPIVATPQQANTLTNLDEWRPSAAGYGSSVYGTVFALLWVRHGVGSGTSQGVYARRFAQNGTALDVAELRVDDPASNVGAQDAPCIAAWPDGRVACAWQDGAFNTSAPSPDGQGVGILARVLNASLTPLTPQFVVNTVTTNDQFEPQISTDLVSTFVVGWSGETTVTAVDAYFRRFTAAGVAVDPGDVNVTPTNGSAQYLMGVAMTPAGEWIVTWQDAFTPGFLGSRNGFARYTPVGGGAQIESGLIDPVLTYEIQLAPRMAADQFGNFRVSWSADDGMTVYLRTQVAQRSMLYVTTPVPIGQTATAYLDSPATPNGYFQLAASFSRGPTLVDSRSIRLGLDDLFTLSVFGYAPTVFANFSGVLSATGTSSAPTINVPYYPPASGAVIYLAYVVLAPGYPLNVQVISDTAPLAIF